MPSRSYVGRFAPSPTGRLHLGSMVAAVASWVDARAHGGTWLVRMEDLDPPREIPGAAQDILQTLLAFGLTWDGEVAYQSQRGHLYQAGLDELLANHQAFGCICTRKQLQEDREEGAHRYPGTCRNGLPSGVQPRSHRFLMPEGKRLSWVDRLAGEQCHDSDDIGDIIVKRADGHWAYHLAVVIDDADQGVTHVVRGADLLDSTPIHLALQQALGLNPLTYAHIPLVVNDQGQKLSKQTMALPVEIDEKEDIMKQVLTHLGMIDIQSNTLPGLLDEGVAWWRKARL